MSNIRGRAAGSRVYEFRAHGDKPVWIAWATGWDEPRPAAGSAGVAWLAECSSRPCWEWLPSCWLNRELAIGLSTLRRRQARAAGRLMLAGRVYQGSGPRRPITVVGQQFPSIRAASRSLGVSRRRIYLMAGDGGYDGCKGRGTGPIGPAR